MSHYGHHHPQHYQASVMPEKPWDMIESSAAINSTAASMVNSRFGISPNGYSLNDGPTGYNETNANGANGQQQSQYPHWQAVRLPTAVSPTSTPYNQSSMTGPPNHWMSYQQQQQQQQLQQRQQLSQQQLSQQQLSQQQLLHHQLSVSTPLLQNPLTSPTSPPQVPSRSMNPYLKLPQHATTADNDESLKVDLRQRAAHQSPTYRSSHFTSPSATLYQLQNNEIAATFNGLLSSPIVNAEQLSANRQQLSPNYNSLHLSANNNNSSTAFAKTSPLHHSNMELDILRVLAASSASAKPEQFPLPKVLCNTSSADVNLNQPIPQQRNNPLSPQFSEHSGVNLFNSNRLNGETSTAASSASSSAFCRPVARKSSPIPTDINASASASSNVASNDLEVAKTMLSIRECPSPGMISNLEVETANFKITNQQMTNTDDYQQISPAADNTSVEGKSPANGHSTNDNDNNENENENENEECSKDSDEEMEDCNGEEKQENETDPVEEQPEEQDAPKSPNALSIVEMESGEKEEEKIDENEKNLHSSEIETPPPQQHSSQRSPMFSLSGTNLPLNLPTQLSVASKSRNSFAQFSSDTLPPTKMSSKDSSPESQSSLPSPMLSSSGFPNFTLNSPSLQNPFSFSHTSASLVSGPQNTGAMGNVSLQNIHTMSSQQGNVYTCQICRFSSTSKFHFNSHMNTHTDHKCKYCDYTSRTVGRLKRHMNDFHTHSDRAETPTNISQESRDSSGHMSQPPSPDESVALIDSQLDSVVSSVAEHNQSGGLNKPATSNKPKTYRCKQCNHVTRSKNEFWDHQRSHIKGDRVLSCPKCPFVTEYKHHLEYHLRNHFGSKPFKCAKCNYTCVNKSMLNSHMKSHSNFYQYRCTDCTYATKYCHSLKLHLRKYGHTPATVMNPDGTAVENIVLDAFGNRRSSKSRKAEGHHSHSSAHSAHGGGGVSVSTASNIASTSSSLLPPMTSPPVTNANPLISPTFAPFMDLIKQQQELAAMVNIGMSAWGAQLPRVPDISMVKTEPSGTSGSNVDYGASASILKCNFCSFHTADGKDSLAAHMLKHIMENEELCRMYGLGEGVGTSNSTGSESSTPGEQYAQSSGHPMDASNGQLCSTPRDDRGSGGSGGYFGSIERASPSHEMVSQDSNSPASTSGGKISGDEALGLEQATHSNNRRKGKAFKLDKIALRLQGRVSPSPPGYSNEDNEKNDEPSSGILNVNGNGGGISLLASGNRNSFKSSSGNTNQRSSEASAFQKSYKQAPPNVRLNRAESTSSLTAASRQTTAVNSNGRETARSVPEEYPGGHITAQPISIDWSNAYVCNYCEIAFKDCIMHTMHMGYHCIHDPFKCNICGQQSKDKLDMFLHIARAPHS